MKLDQVITGRIKGIRYERFGVSLTTKSSDLQDASITVPDDDFSDLEKKSKIINQFRGKKEDGTKRAQYIKV